MTAEAAAAPAISTVLLQDEYLAPPTPGRRCRHRLAGRPVIVQRVSGMPGAESEYPLAERILASLNGVTVADVRHTTAIPRVLA
jgi:hypothetical protein